MTEEEARGLVERLTGLRAMVHLERLVGAVLAENERQNLIARSTTSSIWARHVLDSVQLLRLAEPTGTWLDIGTGGGFPGLAIAAVADRPIILIEPRRRRAAFLADTADNLGLRHVQVVQASVAGAPTFVAQTISARAVGAMGTLFSDAEHCATSATVWLFPRGASYDHDLASTELHWGGMFHVEQSLTNPAARIIIARNVVRR